MKIINGTKVFKTNDDDSISLLRIIREPKDGTVLAIDESNGKKVVINEKDLENDFTVLRPNALISFIIGTTGNLDDVLVLVYRRKEMEESSELPWCVCRQNITDFFSMAIREGLFAGMSLTQNTIPEDVDMRNVLSCDSVSKQINIAFYYTDKLDDILNLIKPKDLKSYDNVLYNLFMKHMRHNAENVEDKDKYIKNTMKNNEVDGYYKTLRDLLYYNNFMCDVLNGFGITPITLDFSGLNEKPLPKDYKEFFEFMYAKNITNSLVLKYENDIEFDKIETDHIIVSDANEDIYVITFTTAGKYHIPLENIESSDNINKLMRVVNPQQCTSSLSEASSIIRINQDKYK